MGTSSYNQAVFTWRVNTTFQLKGRVLGERRDKEHVHNFFQHLSDCTPGILPTESCCQHSIYCNDLRHLMGYQCIPACHLSPAQSTLKKTLKLFVHTNTVFVHHHSPRLALCNLLHHTPWRRFSPLRGHAGALLRDLKMRAVLNERPDVHEKMTMNVKLDKLKSDRFLIFMELVWLWSRMF